MSKKVSDSDSESVTSLAEPNLAFLYSVHYCFGFSRHFHMIMSHMSQVLLLSYRHLKR